MVTCRRRVWAALGIAAALAATFMAPVGSQAQSSAGDPVEATPSSASASSSAAPKPHHAPAAVAASASAQPAAVEAPVVDSSAVASENAEYHDELMAAAASLKADIQAESDASAATVTTPQSGPTSFGVIVAGVVTAFAILVGVIVIPASLRARRKRREMVADMISGKPRRKR